MQTMRHLLLPIAFLAFASPALAQGLFRSVDPLAQRDEYGLLHQHATTVPTDFERRRFWSRLTYNMQSGRSLTNDPAYVATLQTALRRTGYYCGEPDGVFTAEVSDAIAKLQKNYSMKVTGNLTVPVRRALRLP